MPEALSPEFTWQEEVIIYCFTLHIGECKIISVDGWGKFTIKRGSFDPFQIKIPWYMGLI